LINEILALSSKGDQVKSECRVDLTVEATLKEKSFARQNPSIEFDINCLQINDRVIFILEKEEAEGKVKRINKKSVRIVCVDGAELTIPACNILLKANLEVEVPSSDIVSKADNYNSEESNRSLEGAQEIPTTNVHDIDDKEPDNIENLPPFLDSVQSLGPFTDLPTSPGKISISIQDSSNKRKSCEVVLSSPIKDTVKN
jgi:hypothetical protein